VIDALLVVVCGGIGACARFVVDAVIQSRRRSEFPVGTLLVNLSGCFALGVVSGAHASHRVTLLLGTATVGSYTTFSTWMLETHRPAQDGEPAMAWRNLIVALLAGLASAELGRLVGGL
jgi:CrcB protein